MKRSKYTYNFINFKLLELLDYDVFYFKVCISDLVHLSYNLRYI